MKIDSKNRDFVRGVLRAYDDGVTLEAISHLFKVGQHDLINLIHAYKVGRGMR